MWSVNLEASISGEYQTLGGHSGRPSEELGSLMTGTGVTGSDCDKFGNTSERRRELWVHLGASGSAGDKPGSTWERRRQV